MYIYTYIYIYIYKLASARLRWVMVFPLCRYMINDNTIRAEVVPTFHNTTYLYNLK